MFSFRIFNWVRRTASHVRSVCRSGCGARLRNACEFRALTFEYLEPRTVLTADLDWSTILGGGATGGVAAAAVDAAGDIFVVGTFEGTAQLNPAGGAQLTSLGRGDVFFAKYAATGALVWVKQIGGASVDGANDIALDSQGNIFITGRFYATADFDPGADSALLTSAGADDIFVAKYDSNGDYVWAHRIGNSNSDAVVALATTVAGEVVIAGRLDGTVDFDPGAGVANLTSVGSYDTFVCKLDSSGGFVWADRFGGTSQDDISDLVVDAEQNILFTGRFQGTADFDPGPATASLTAVGGFDAFVAKLDSAGNYIWAKKFSGNSDEMARGLTIDAANNVYVVGDFKGTVDFNPGTGVANLAGRSIDSNSFVVKLDSAGNYAWATQFYGTAGWANYATGINIDLSGGVIITGTFGATADFDGGSGVANLTSTGDYDIYFVKLSASNGGFGWAKQLGGGLADSARETAIDAAGNIILVGTFQADADFDPGPGSYRLNSGIDDGGFVAKLTSAGAFTWAFATSASAAARAQATKVDADGNVYVMGRFAGAAQFHEDSDQPPLISAGASNDFIGAKYDVYLAKFAADGTLLWSKRFGNANDDVPGDIAVDFAGNVIVSGTFSGTVDFDPNAGVAELAGSGAFLVKLDRDGNYVWARQFAGGNGKLSVDSAGNVIVAGAFTGTKDFDPGADAANLTAQGSSDVYILKLDSSGNYIWARTVGGTSIDGANAVTVDSHDNIIVVGQFQETVDMDPGAGTFIFVGSSYTDNTFILKLNTIGNFVWARRVGTQDDAIANGVAVDGLDNVFVAGKFERTADFDPGVGTANMTSVGSYDAFVLKLNSSGNYVWAKQFGGTGEDEGVGVAVHPFGNVVVTGLFRGTADLDPGLSTVSVTSFGSSDVFVAMLAADGNYLWSRQIGGVDLDTATDIALDHTGDVFLTGWFVDKADFDPGAGSHTLDPGPSGGAGFLLKLRDIGVTHLLGELKLTLAQSASAVIDTPLIGIAHPDATTGPLTYTLVAAPTFGKLYDSDRQLDAGSTFTQADLDAGTVSYRQDGREATTDSFRFRLGNGTGASLAATTFAITITPVAPTVVGVYARASGTGGWSAAFLTYLATSGLGDATLGYLLSSGATQLKTLPWSNVNTISIRFSEEVAIARNDLSIVNSADGSTVPAVTGFTWDSTLHTGTWTFAAALPRDKYLLHIGAAIVDVGGHVLDGEWTVSSSTQSGNGEGGGDFNFRFNVLPGDFDGSNGVTITEVLQARNRAGKGTASSGYVYREDVDGSGGITITEILQARNRTATSITGLSEPVAPGSTPQSPSELAPLVPGSEAGDYVPFHSVLTQAELAPIIDEAVARWEYSGLVPQDFDWSKLRFAITDLGPAYLGLGNPDGSILLDDDGAGWGWFVDDAPKTDDDFAAATNGEAATRMDLLTVVMHEIGHALGYPTGSAQETPAAALMSQFLAVGTRRTPGVTQSHSALSDLLVANSRAAEAMLGIARLAAVDYATLALGQVVAIPIVDAPTQLLLSAVQTTDVSTSMTTDDFDALSLQVVTIDGDLADRFGSRSIACTAWLKGLNSADSPSHSTRVR